MSPINRRTFCSSAAAVAASVTSVGKAAPSAGTALQPVEKRFTPKYIMASCMYGYQYVGEIMPEVRRAGASALDIWPKAHGNQREQLNDLGEERFAAMLKANNITLGCITQYKLGPFGLQEEMQLAKRMGADTIVAGGQGPTGLKGDELKKAVGHFIEQMKPHLAVAEENGVTIAIENHGNNLIDSADSLRYLAELRPSEQLGIALAPYHLPQDTKLLSELIHDVGHAIAMFYMWQHGNGCMKKLPKEEELLQMPGRGPLDFRPIVKALGAIDYSGWSEIFMHPVPRGIPILPTAKEVTDEINRAREYIAKCIG